MTDKKYTMQIIDQNGRIVKSETFYEYDNLAKRTATLMPSEKEYIDCFKENIATKWINYILESRGLKRMNDKEKFEVKDGILILENKEINERLDFS